VNDVSSTHKDLLRCAISYQRAISPYLNSLCYLASRWATSFESALLSLRGYRHSCPSSLLSWSLRERKITSPSVFVPLRFHRLFGWLVAMESNPQAETYVSYEYEMFRLPGLWNTKLMLLCSRWVEQCARPLHRVMASAKNLKELQAIWMINALEDLYTRGRTFSEKQKIEYLWNFARDDAHNFVSKIGPRYALIPDEIYVANEFTVDQFLCTRGQCQFNPVSFERKAKSCRRRLLTIAAAWLEFLRKFNETPGKYSSGIDVKDRVISFEADLPRRCE
jgi:hypothetical protein